MLKFCKYLRAGRSLAVRSQRRLASGRKCPPMECPPSYECKQPEKDEFEEQLAFLKMQRVPSVFVEKTVKDYRKYRAICLFVCVPILICFYINTFITHKKERKRPKFVEFSYLRIRKKPYAWHPTRTLFHNPRYNALPTGYEIEVPEDEEYDPFEPDKK